MGFNVDDSHTFLKEENQGKSKIEKETYSRSLLIATPRFICGPGSCKQTINYLIIVLWCIPPFNMLQNFHR